MMHVGRDASDLELEAEANAFASAFLLPRRGFVPEFPRTSSPNWDALRVLKRRWGVSLAAIIRRARDLRLVDGLYYQRAYKQLSAWRWNVNEPDEGHVPEEKPEIISNALKLVEQGLGLRAIDFANDLGWSARLFEQVTGEPCVELPDNVISLRQARALRSG